MKRAGGGGGWADMGRQAGRGRRQLAVRGRHRMGMGEEASSSSGLGRDSGGWREEEDFLGKKTGSMKEPELYERKLHASIKHNMTKQQ